MVYKAAGTATTITPVQSIGLADSLYAPHIVTSTHKGSYEKERTDCGQAIAKITLQGTQTFHLKDQLWRSAVAGLRHGLRAIQTTAFSRRPPDNKKPRGCGGRSPRRSVERVCSRRDFDGGLGFPTWLTSIAINSALMILRKKRAAPEITLEGNDDCARDGVGNEIRDHSPNPESRYALSEAQRTVGKAVQRLRPTLGAAVQIQLQGRSMQEAAEAIGISLAVAKGLFQANAALRRSPILKLTRRHRFRDQICNAFRR